MSKNALSVLSLTILITLSFLSQKFLVSLKNLFTEFFASRYNDCVFLDQKILILISEKIYRQKNLVSDDHFLKRTGIAWMIASKI